MDILKQKKTCDIELIKYEQRKYGRNHSKWTTPSAREFDSSELSQHSRRSHDERHQLCTCTTILSIISESFTRFCSSYYSLLVVTLSRSDGLWKRVDHTCLIPRDNDNKTTDDVGRDSWNHFQRWANAVFWYLKWKKKSRDKTTYVITTN